jgi:hypothetical protein
MRHFTLALPLFIEAMAHGQGFNERYDAFGWGYAQSAFGIEALSDGYMVISGSSDYDSIAPGEWFFHGSVTLTRIDLQGDMLWEMRSWRPDHSALPGWANCCDSLPGGGYIIGGNSEDTTGRDEVFLMRFDAEGDTLWTRVFNGPTDGHYWIGRQVKRTADGGFLIVGDTGIDIVTDGNDAFAVKTDSYGNEQWRRYYSWPPPRSEGLVSCHMGPANTYYLGGSAFPTDNNGDHWVMRVDTAGEELWEVVWGGPYSEGSLQVISASDGHAVVFSGISHAPDYGSMRPYIAKLDSADGSLLWEMEYGQEHYGTVLFAGKECPDGDLIGAGGTFVSQAPNNEMGLLLRASAQGDSLWMFTCHFQDSVITNGQGRFYDVLPTNDGGFIAAGVTRNPVGGPFPPGYSQDTWVVKVDSLGCIVPGCNSVGISDQATNLLDALTLFPNPAHGQATVQLTLPPSVARLPLELSLVGMDGRVVLRERIAGNGRHQLALQGVSAGVYHVHVASGGRWLTGAKLAVE